MAPREVEELRRTLAAVADAAPRLACRLEALHSVAFDRSVSDAVKVMASHEGWALADVGVAEAKDAWRVLARVARHAAVQLEAACVAAENILAAGESADVSLRGTLLGDDDESASSELARRVSRQRARLARGEFDPGRAEPQPGVGRR